MNEAVELGVLPKDGNAAIKELEAGHLVAARAGGEFMYIFEENGKYLMFSHFVDSKEAGERSFEKNECYTAMVKGVIKVADSAFSAEFDKQYSIYEVMAMMEEAILKRYPEKETNKRT